MGEPKSYMTVKQVPARYPAFTERALRFIIFNRETNGFSECIRRIGKKILIDEAAFCQWIDKRSAA